LFDWILRTVGEWGLTGVGALMFLENIFPPIPSELVMPLAGFAAARGTLSFWPAVLAGTVGSLAGAGVWYGVGRRIGHERLWNWVDDHGRWLTLSRRDLDRAQKWFEDRGGLAVMVGRLVPGIRTLISVPAGIAKMPILPFLAYSAAGTVIWTAILASLGRMLGSQYTSVEKFMGPASYIVLAAVISLYIYRVISYKPPRRASSRGKGEEGRRTSDIPPGERENSLEA